MGARAPPRTAAQGRGRPRRRAPRWRGRRGRRAVGSWFPCRFPGERCRGAETLAALTAAANALSCARRQRRCEGGDMAGVPFDRHRAVVLPEWIDYNGHMNVDYYLLAFDQATDLFFDHLGLGAAHRAATGGSTFAGDIHLTYRRELREGDPLRVTSQLLGFDEKRLRFFQHMYHAEEGFLAATMESLGLYVDLARRRVAPFPAAIRERLAAVFAADRDLPLPPEAGRTIAKPPLRQP